MNLKKFRLVDLEMSRNVQSIVNVIANVLSFGIAIAISFFISPYIVRTLGAEANGFVTLANNFVAYATLLKTALNGVGSRYIIVEYHKGNIEKANVYFSSLFYGDLILAIIISVASALCVWRLENIINISPELVLDVKILFGFVLFNFVFSTATNIINVASHVKNKIYLQSIRDIQAYLIRAVLLVALFTLFEPRIAFLGIATFVPSIVVVFYNIYYKRKLTPDLKINRKYFSFATIKELVSQGIWNSIASLGTMLLSSLDLLIANLLVNENDMGILSVAKSMPNVVSSFGTTVATVFFAAMAIDYAKEDMSVLVKTVKQSTRFSGYVTTIPLAFLIVYGREFYSLWQPTLDSKQLHILSLLTVAGLIFLAGASAVGNIFTIALKVKERSIVTLITGATSLAITLALVKFTNLGIYAIAGVSSVVNTISMLVYVVPYAAKSIGKPAKTFMPVVLRSLLSTGILVLIGYAQKTFMPCANWFTLIASALLFAILSAVANWFIMMDQETRGLALNMIKSKIFKKG